MKKLLYIVICCLLFVIAVVPSVACASSAMDEICVTSREAVLMSEDGQMIYQHNATEKRPIASMTKIMTLLCTYDAIKQGKVSLEDNVIASENAASMGGSQVYLDANCTYKLENLIKSIVVCSANDSCVAVAEHVSGSVQNFVRTMNDKATSIGLVATHFENCTGLPHVSQFSCARDVAVMFRELIRNPHYFECSKIWMEDFVHPSGRVTGMTNTNKLVRFYDGCDAGKTGYTNEAKHCLCATAKRGSTRVIAVVVGANDSKTRFAEVSNMFNYAFANYECKVYLDGNSKLDNVSLRGGVADGVELVADGKLCAFGRKGENNYTVTYQSENNVCAPVKCGQVLGKASLVDDNGNVVSSVNLVAKNDVAEKSYWKYFEQIITNER